MMQCKYCQTEVASDSAFCPQCGESLLNTCPRCQAAVRDDARFCTGCGMPLDGSTVCAECGAVVPNETPFCPQCGFGTNGQRKCPHCGAVTEGDSRFCPDCGNPLGRTKPRISATRSAPSDVKTFIYQLIRRWVSVAALVAIFIVSFFGMFRMPTTQLGYRESVSARGTDLFCGMFRLIDPPSKEKALTDYLDYCVKHADFNKTSEKLLERYGVIRFMITEESAESASFTLTIVLLGLLQLGIWGVTIGFLILETIRAIQYSMRRDAKPSRGAWAFGLTFALPLCFMPIAAETLAGCAATILIISACCLAGMIACRYAVERQSFHLMPTLRQAIGLAVVIVLFAVTAANAYTIRLCSETQPDTITTLYGAGDLTSIIAQLDHVDIDTSLRLIDYIDEMATAALGIKDLPLASLVISEKFAPSALAGFSASASYLPAFQVIGWMSFFWNLAFIAIGALLICKQATALAEEKSSPHIAWNGVLAAIALAQMIFVIVTCALGSSIAAQVINLPESLSYHIAAMPIVLVVFSVLNFVASIILTVLRSPKKSVA